MSRWSAPDWCFWWRSRSRSLHERRCSRNHNMDPHRDCLGGNPCHERLGVRLHQVSVPGLELYDRLCRSRQQGLDGHLRHQRPTAWHEFYAHCVVRYVAFVVLRGMLKLTMFMADGGDDRGDSPLGGDFASGQYKGQCQPDEHIAGIAFTTAWAKPGTPSAILCRK